MRVHFHLRRSGRLIDGPCQDLIVLLLRCPVCHAHLRSDGNAAACARGHTFDRAREGYLNLLPVQQKNSLNPGDDAAMVAARSEFLDAGYYEPLRVALVRVLADVRPTDLLDCGCGEGWYSTALSRTAAATTALDISKDAIKRAARRDRAITWLVASSADIPLMDASVDAIAAIFSPIHVAEAARVLKAQGSLVVAAPDEKHLLELRAALYPQVRPHQPHKWLDSLAPTFTLLRDSRVQFPIDLPDHAAVNALLKMTPYYWRAERQRRTQVEALTGLSTQADFRILHFVREA